MRNIFFLITICLSPCCSSYAQVNRTDIYNLEDGIAINGYDVVSYITQNKAVKGKKNLSYDHEGVTYFFSSEHNKRLFVSDPEKYLPAYGGWCAYAMAIDGKKIGIDPEIFKVTNGKTFFFYNSWITNIPEKWNSDEPSLIRKADKNWKNICKCDE